MSGVNSISFSSNRGRMLENQVFLDLRRAGKEVYYFKGKKECDFLVKEKNRIIAAIQVCYELNEDNKERELNGLVEALEKFDLPEGMALTYAQEDELKVSGKIIRVKPVWKWLLE